MSGPKHSDFRLAEEERRRQELERRRRIEEQMKREVEEQIRHTRDRIESLNKEFFALAHNAIREAKEVLTDQTLVLQIQERQAAFENLLNLADKTAAVSLMQLQQKSKQFRDVLRSGNLLLQSLQEDIVQLNQQMVHSKTYQAEQDYLEKSKQFKVERKQIGLERKGADQEQRKVHLVVDEFREVIQPYLDHIEVKRLYDSVLRIAESSISDTEYRIQQLEQRKQAFLDLKDKIDAQTEEYEQLSLHYRSLCMLLKIPIETGLTIESLRERIQSLEKRLAEQEEVEYIAASVRDVMGSLGYDLIASDYMVTPKRTIDHQIFEISDFHAVNVFTSDNGSVLFEVTGVTEEKREPTSLEKLRLKESMEAFCQDYTVIKKLLRDRGVELINEDLKGADEKYARMIDISRKKKHKKQLSRVTKQVKRGKEQQL